MNSLSNRVVRSCAAGFALGGLAFSQFTTRVSVDSAGGQSDGPSSAAAISQDERFISFNSLATTLVPGDTNGRYDIFVHDRLTGATTRASVASDGTQANGDSFYSALSGDGRFVALSSDASNLVANDANWTDIFVHDRPTGQTELASLSSTGVQASASCAQVAISADGRFVAFVTVASNLVPNDTNGQFDVFVRDRQTAQTILVSVAFDGTGGNDRSETPALSADGRFIAFQSYAGNMVAGDANELLDVFVRDMALGTTTLVSVDSSGAQGLGSSQWPAISADGRRVAFTSASSGLVGGDTNGATDAFWRDLDLGVTRRVSVNSAGGESAEGSDIPVAISGDGRMVAFSSTASHLAGGDTNSTNDVFLHDTVTGTTVRVDLGVSGEQGNDWTFGPALGATGHVTAYSSLADTLVDDDSNGFFDVFASAVQIAPVVYCTAKVNSQSCTPAIAWSGYANPIDPAPFTISTDHVINSKSGLLFYGHQAFGLPFQGGVLCVQPAIVRTQVQNSGGTPPPARDCSGTLSYDFNALIQSGQDPSLTAFSDVYAQFWYRDPDDFTGFGTGLSNALRFTIVP